MSSAFFRRPTDESSDSSSESNGPDEAEQELPLRATDTVIEEGGDAATTESLSSEGSLSLGSLGEAIDVGTTNQFANVDHHRTNLLKALLEDFARNRACEMMNNAQPGSQFHRLSAEVQPLAANLYRKLSQSLTLTGLLSAGQEGSANQQTRAAYLAGIESLAFGTVQKSDVLSARIAQSQLAPSIDEQQLAFARFGSLQQQSPFSQLLQQSVAFDHNAGPHMSSPYSDLILSAPTTPYRSHYESSFQQLGLLGKGGFGRVYHTFNVFDKKEYAVKKIPLSPRLSKRYRESGHKELENVLREVQALAQLEHNNVVRYHATWIEEPKKPVTMYQSAAPSLSFRGRRLIADGTADHDQSKAAHQMPVPRVGKAVVSEVDDGGIIFGSEDVSQRLAGQDSDRDNEEQRWAGKHTDDPETTSVRTSEIFTDGHARPVAGSHHDLVMDSSVYVLHVQMSVYPMTLAEYLAPTPAANSTSAVYSPGKRYCFHLVPALRLLMGILCGLQYIHSQGLVHRDIKPSNIFISRLPTGVSAGLVAPEGYHDVGCCPACSDSPSDFVNPRIGDFGLVAELAGDVGVDVGPTSKNVGTQYYRPPSRKDKWQAAPSVDEKLDVFALGVIMVELLWECATSTERLHVLQDLQKGKVPPGLSEKIDDESHHPQNMGKLVVDGVLKMIESDAWRRWSCWEIKEWVDMLLARCRTPLAGSSTSGTTVTLGEPVDKGS